MASTYIQRTASSAGNQKKWTFSAWVKKSSIGADAGIFGFPENSTNYLRIRFKGGDNIQIDNDYNDTLTMNLRTNAVYRDTNAWYHIVVAYDSAQATDTNRVKLWVNNEQVTSWDSPSYPSQNANTRLGNSGANIQVGATVGNEYFNGVMSHVHYCDGYAYAPSDFGETDSTTGQWKIKTSPSGLSYGTNGFWWLKDSIATTDHSSNSNVFSVGGGTLTKTEDCPSNVFAVGNNLIGRHSNGADLLPSYSNAGLTALADGSAWKIFKSTLGASSGKYYAEFKWISDSNTRYAYVGIYDEDNYANKVTGYPYVSDIANSVGYYSENGVYYTGGSSTSFGNSYSSNNIIGCAVDLDNNKLYFSKDGSWQGGGNPTNGTGGISITANRTYTFGLQLYAVGSIVFSANFGNGYFGTTAVSSAGTNASGNGIFEYDVPTGYTALSTKGLNT